MGLFAIEFFRMRLCKWGGSAVCFDLFFKRHTGHRDRHSFPTRRSSDLPRRAPARPGPPETRCAPGVRGISGRSSRRPHRDRKSTRLNSSHSSISYAVFCLKKKNSLPIIFNLIFSFFLTLLKDPTFYLLA